MRMAYEAEMEEVRRWEIWNEQENAKTPIKRVTGVNEDFLGGRVKEKRTAEDFQFGKS